MSATVPPSSGSVLITDEQALRKIFDDEYDRRCTEAKAKLGDHPQLAPRVVEGAFANLWRQRSAVANRDDVDRFLDQEIQHGAARALSKRHSASRFGGVAQGEKAKAHDEHGPDKAASWEAVARSIHGGEHTASAHAAAAS